MTDVCGSTLHTDLTAIGLAKATMGSLREAIFGVSSVYSREDFLNRLLLRLNVQPKKSDRERSPCAASGLGFDFADGLTFIKEKPSPFVIITTIIKLTPHPLRSR